MSDNVIILSSEDEVCIRFFSSIFKQQSHLISNAVIFFGIFYLYPFLMIFFVFCHCWCCAIVLISVFFVLLFGAVVAVAVVVVCCRICMYSAPISKCLVCTVQNRALLNLNNHVIMNTWRSRQIEYLFANAFVSHV